MSGKQDKKDRREAAAQFIVWERVYWNHQRRKVVEKVLIAGELPPDFVRFRGEGSPGGGAPPATFPIRGAPDVADAFARWRAAYDAGIASIKARIVAAGPGEFRRLRGASTARAWEAAAAASRVDANGVRRYDLA